MAKTRGKAEDLAGGVRVSPANHPRYSWRISYFTGEGEDRKRHQKYFNTKNEAMEAGSTISGELMSAGQSEGQITKAERRAVMRFREMVAELPEAIARPSLDDAVTLLHDTFKLRNKSKTVREIVDRYLLILERKKVSDQYIYTIRHRLEQFVADYGDWMACDVSQDIAGEWLEDLICAPTSFNHFRAALVQCFNCALDIGAVEDNPVAKIPKKKKGASEIGILTVDQAQALLSHASDKILPGIVLGLFAGIRRAELCRMDWREIDFEQDHVEVTAAKSKTAARRLIPMRKALKSWLLLHRKPSGPIMPTEMIWRTRLKTALKAAGIEHWPHNALRHSFASYHLAHYKDAAVLALEMGHGSTRMIFEHYRALVTPKAGANFWGMQ